MIGTVTLKLELLIDGDELLRASMATESVAVSGLTPGDALTAREGLMRVLNDRELIVDVCDEGSVLLVHRLIQHEAIERGEV